MSLCVSVCVHRCVCVCLEAREQARVSLLRSCPLWFLRQDLSVAWSFANRHGWLTSNPQGSASLAQAYVLMPQWSGCLSGSWGLQPATYLLPESSPQHSSDFFFFHSIEVSVAEELGEPFFWVFYLLIPSWGHRKAVSGRLNTRKHKAKMNFARDRSCSEFQ